MKFVVLLRGINVGGHKKIIMSELREALYSIQQIDSVLSYIQSGNLVINSNLSKEELSQVVEKEIFRLYNFDVVVIIRTAEEWDGILSNIENIAKKSLHINRVYGIFLNKYPNNENVEKLKKVDFSPDSYIVNGKEIFTIYVNGMGKTKMNISKFEKLLELNATARNLNTIRKLKGLLDA